MSDLVQTFSAADVRPGTLPGLTLVDFWAPWCGPCRMVGPIVEQLAGDYQGRLTVGKVNIDEQPEAAMAYSVVSIPTLILFKDGVEVERLIGARGKPAIAQVIDKHL